MSLLGQITDKPWLPSLSTVEVMRDPRTVSSRARRAALHVFLSVVAVLFFLLIIAYADRMAYEDWRPAPQQQLLWANTVMLILGSLAFEWARYALRHERFDAMRLALLAAGAFTVLFLIGQVLAWQQLRAIPFFELTNPAIAFFYLITGLHGLHLVGGLVAWGRTATRSWGAFEPSKMRQSVQLCATYWHFLLGVWCVLFGLLFSGDNLDLLLKLCGIR